MDYDEQSGLGHISRSRAIIETVSNYATEIFLSSKLNPLEIESQIDFLNQTKWISHEEAELMHFDLVYVDTYSFDMLKKVENLGVEHKILLIDSNYTTRLPNWADIIIDLEQSNPRNWNFGGTYLFGDILVHSELESTRRSREEHGARKSVCSNLTALVNFGGSIKTEPYLKLLKSTFFYNMDILYVVYCPFTLIQNLKNYFWHYKNVEIKPFSPNYLQDLATCDFLVTNSGTSFIEGLFVDVPMAIFNLFPNAQLNFEKLRYNKQVIYSGLATELESDWQSNVLHSLQLGGDLLTLESDDDSKIEILDEGILKVALSSLCLT